MRGLALEGGGSRGAYHIGVYQACLEQGLTFDAICGTSIGAVNAALLAQGDYDLLQHLWKTLGNSDLFEVDNAHYAKLFRGGIEAADLSYYKEALNRVRESGGVDTRKMKAMIDSLVDVDRLLVSQPDTGEQALEITEALVRSGAVDVVVVDSVAALVPKAEIDGEMGDAFVGLHARLMSQALRKLAGAIAKSNCVVIFINQLREKVGVVYGNPEVTTGGRALKYYSSVRIDIRRVEGLKDSSGQFIGNHTRAKIVKNKVAPPFREAEFDIMFGEGISKVGELLDLGVKLGIVQKSGAWFNYGDMRLGQGRDNSKQFLKDNPEIANDIEGQIRANADKLYASRRSSGRTAAADKAEEAAAPAEGTKEPVVKAPARSSESELDIMVED